MKKYPRKPSPFVLGLDRLAGEGSWFEKQKRVLPWRDEPSLYRVWISEIMLQQTQVVTVVPYFERFLAKFPTVEALASAPEEDVMAAWAGLGYYSRARNLHRAAKMIVERGGTWKGFPRDRAGWLEIPGVGEYTAGAILSIALDQPEAILDGNVERVISRMRRVTRSRGDAAYKARLWRLSRLFVETAHSRGIEPSNLNQALMELGATVCSPKKPKCLLCPMRDFCRAHRDEEEESFPPKKKPKEWVEVEEKVHCWIDSRGRVLVQKRAAGEWRAGLWDLPEKRPPFPAEKIGEVTNRLVVTRHKVTRKTTVWQLGSSLRAAERTLDHLAGEAKWVDPREPGVPVGSAFRKTYQHISETYPF